jgi:glycosyltransferase involved in cell wall biosynthesis
LNYVRRLRIGIDGRAFSSPAAGVRRYVSALVRALMSLGEPIDLVALGGARDALPAGLSDVAEPWHPPTNLGWSVVGLPAAAARAGVDIIHAPAYTAPLWSSVPTVLTIHDVSYERHPEWYPYRRDVLRRAFYRRSARAAAHVLTDSEFSAGEIAAAYRIPRERITVAPLGVSRGFAPAGATKVRLKADTTSELKRDTTSEVKPDTTSELEPDTTSELKPDTTNASKVRLKADPTTKPGRLPDGVTRPFLLHVGDLHERRNLPVVVRALVEAQAVAAMPPLSLVLAGVDRGVGDSLRALARSGNAPDAMVCLGTVSDDQLLALYQEATALVYPSRYEGFGLPVLEAMACGTPVIASRAASMPEVLGEAGVLLDPDDTPGWAQAIANVVTDEGLRARMRTAGVARAREFTWARTARLTLAVYRQVAERT